MAFWKNDEELFSLAKKELFVALAGDVYREIGFKL